MPNALTRRRLLYPLLGGAAVLAALVAIAVPRPPQPGTALVVLASPSGDQLSPVRLDIGDGGLTVGGEAPKAPESRTAATLRLDPGFYSLRIDGQRLPYGLTIRANQVEPVLIAVSGGRVVPGGVYVGAGNVNLGLGELSGKLAALPEFSLVDHEGRQFDRGALLGRDTVVAAFNTDCREVCPLYTALFFQLRRTAPDVRLVEVTTDPARDTPEALAAYRARVGADWTFATGTAEAVAAFWAPFGVQPSSGSVHSSSLVLMDRYGFLRAAFTGVPDVGGRLPGALDAQLDEDGRRLLAGHGEGWGAPQVVDALRTIAGPAPVAPSAGPVPGFSLRSLDGRMVSLEEFRGRPVVLNFWWSGCPPCREEMPAIQRFADRHAELQVLFVDVRDSPEAARRFVRSVGVHGTVLLDSDGRVAAVYRVAGFPTTVFVRPDGTEASRVARALTAEELEAHVANLGG